MFEAVQCYSIKIHKCVVYYDFLLMAQTESDKDNKFNKKQLNQLYFKIVGFQYVAYSL